MYLYGLEAMAHGATAALIAFIPGVVLFWRLTRGMDGGRARRPFVTVAAAYGIAVGLAGLWAANFERSNFVDEAMSGAMMGCALAALVAFLILLLFPRKG